MKFILSVLVIFSVSISENFKTDFFSQIEGSLVAKCHTVNSIPVTADELKKLKRISHLLKWKNSGLGLVKATRYAKCDIGNVYNIVYVFDKKYIHIINASVLMNKRGKLISYWQAYE